MKKNQNNNFVMYTEEFGNIIYIADTEKTKNNLQITDDVKQAQVWSHDFDNSKIAYWKAVTGYNLKTKAA